MFALTSEELQDLRTKISTTNISTKSRTMPKVFTEKGLYMLANEGAGHWVGRCSQYWSVVCMQMHRPAK